MISSKLQSLTRYINQNKTSILLTIGISAIACFFRFFRYQHRWGLAYDQAVFEIITTYSAKNSLIPLLGPFSSGGPFQTGGIWYWLLMIPRLMFPDIILAPWIFLTFLSLITVLILMKIGSEIAGTKLSMIIGLLTAVSPAQITQSSNLSNQTPISFFAALMLYSGWKYHTTSRHVYLFFTSLLLGVASAIHIQAIALAPFLILIHLRTVLKQSLQKTLLIITGLSLPWIPVIYSDSSNNFYNTQNMIRYVLSNEGKPTFEELGRRWMTFVSSSIPHIWSFTTGGIDASSIIVTLMLIGLLFTQRKSILSGFPQLSFLSILSMFVIIRYTRAPLYDSFVVFLHPFILLSTAYVIYVFAKKQAIVGYLLLVLMTIGSVITVLPDIQNATNTTGPLASSIAQQLYKSFNTTHILLYDYERQFVDISYPIVMNLQHTNDQTKPATPVGIAIKDSPHDPYLDELIVLETNGYTFYILESSTSSQLATGQWADISPVVIYNSQQHWFLEN